MINHCDILDFQPIHVFDNKIDTWDWNIEGIGLGTIGIFQASSLHFQGKFWPATCGNLVWYAYVGYVYLLWYAEFTQELYIARSSFQCFLLTCEPLPNSCSQKSCLPFNYILNTWLENPNLEQWNYGGKWTQIVEIGVMWWVQLKQMKCEVEECEFSVCHFEILEWQLL